jgi:hypothetical protein
MSEKDCGERAARTATIHGVIDRIEDNEMAVVRLGDDEDVQIDLPVSLLPQGATDGDHLRLTIRLDEESRASTQDRIRQLQEELLNRSKK